jgi:hypothetical protein
MTAPPKDFDLAAASRILLSRLASLPLEAVARALSVIDAPLYPKGIEPAPRVQPASEQFVAEHLARELECNAGAFEVAVDVVRLSRLPSEELVPFVAELLSTRPWRRLEDRLLLTLAECASDATFALLLEQPRGSSVVRRGAAPNAARLALARLRALIAVGGPMEPRARVWGEELLSLLVERNDTEGQELACSIVDGRAAPDLRRRACVALYTSGLEQNVRRLSTHLQDKDALVRSTAIRAVLSLDGPSAWDSLGGDKLLTTEYAAFASEVLNELGRDLAGTGGVTRHGWARNDPRFEQLARHWLGDKKNMGNAEFVLQGLASS